jgi:hypothetical protein
MLVRGPADDVPLDIHLDGLDMLDLAAAKKLPGEPRQLSGLAAANQDGCRIEPESRSWPQENAKNTKPDGLILNEYRGWMFSRSHHTSPRSLRSLCSIAAIPFQSCVEGKGVEGKGGKIGRAGIASQP